MQCVILAGGLGTRMLPMTARVPKVLLPVCGQPFAHHQLSWLARQGVDEIVFSIGHQGTQIREYVGDGRRWSLSVKYVDEGNELRGTAGALRLALDSGVLAEAFLVIYGDSFLPVPFPPIWDAFEQSGLPALMTVFRNAGQWDTSNVLFESNNIILYDKTRRDPRSDAMRHIDYGLSALHRLTLQRWVPEGIRMDLAEVFHQLSLQSCLAGFEVHQRFYEIGSPRGLADLEAYLDRNPFENNLT